jgi:competence protein ComEC
MKVFGKEVDLNIKPNLPFKMILLWLTFFIVSCMEPIKIDDSFRFTIVNVGEGLAQIGSIGGHSIIWDIGPAEGFDNFLNAYNHLGKPLIETIVISHTHLDHCGGLALLDSTIPWTGCITVSQYEDTTYLRMLAVQWCRKISFKVIKKGDALKSLSNIQISCLWPPPEMPQSISNSNENPFSLVFSIHYGLTRCLIASDIDSVVQKLLVTDGEDLQSDILVIPHHGSANYAQIFLQNVRPIYAVISCSEDNSYGHPSTNLLSYLLFVGAKVFLTFSDGTITFNSNTFYWSN